MKISLSLSVEIHRDKKPVEKSKEEVPDVLSNHNGSFSDAGYVQETTFGFSNSPAKNKSQS